MGADGRGSREGVGDRGQGVFAVGWDGRLSCTMVVVFWNKGAPAGEWVLHKLHCSENM